MNIGKALAISAITGALAGALGACGGTPPAATDPSAAGGAKASCSADHTDKGHCSASSATPASSAAPTQ